MCYIDIKQILRSFWNVLYRSFYTCCYVFLVSMQLNPFWNETNIRAEIVMDTNRIRAPYYATIRLNVFIDTKHEINKYRIFEFIRTWCVYSCNMSHRFVVPAVHMSPTCFVSPTPWYHSSSVGFRVAPRVRVPQSAPSLCVAVPVGPCE